MNKKSEIIEHIKQKRNEYIERDVKAAKYIGKEGLVFVAASRKLGWSGGVTAVGIDIATDVIKHYAPDKYDKWIDKGKDLIEDFLLNKTNKN
ncbi:hypothetical protein [Marinitoga aeolica]|uniref:Uncharacterized protein n=1 Tax=Marinitoga aeolica TaxID=2809031 RepID=A0ABY8PSX6_9BACT|nr:hypothetical protein [Marinitoga aeolica]WGS65710.1 hypothetical protein JRV97_03925 [Marinitoga aeolica]